MSKFKFKAIKIDPHQLPSPQSVISSQEGCFLRKETTYLELIYQYHELTSGLTQN